MGQIDAFMTETNPVYRCPNCRWIFSPGLSLKDRLREAVALLRVYAPELLAEEARDKDVVVLK